MTYCQKLSANSRLSVGREFISRGYGFVDQLSGLAPPRDVLIYMDNLVQLGPPPLGALAGEYVTATGPVEPQHL